MFVGKSRSTFHFNLQKSHHFEGAYDTKWMILMNTFIILAYNQYGSNIYLASQVSSN